ncbi:DNA excision repair protein (rad2) [Ophiocordyceps camponoti-floridani]|uniref:DNA excision repair protein (Rad2) n=1 Tax=Ophiocordyceps camponoti-floridani TaxID=2030778 RepID=A0A8H4VE87_9HYPO|nr:DNA excision repair protein (rad2) [Ophiocordyceps camponoti-floridani]
MGVNGLWTVIQPCARPTNLATLNRKRLAVDASIWIYQFLKAVRDKEGNALRNSHIVGFFRRICKLLWYGILPVFVFDGGAPALKRATIQKRQQRREGRREDAVRTAGKLLAVQMQRAAVDDEERRKRELGRDVSAREALLQQEDAAESSDLVYQAELNMSQREKVQSRRFFKQDAYHLPELDRDIASMGKPEDPRIMSVEELDEYARQFNDGQDINLYDFSKIDFDGDFFKSLPAADRYNILNAARLRSRLRMGYSKDQLEDMFPDRMAFSRFQIERVRERNNLTQRLMFEVGMQGTDLTLPVNARIAGDKDREYILVKNEGAEGGWALGVVSREKDIGQAHKPIDVDAIQVQYQSKDDDEDEDEDEDFEDVPIEGLNRLPKPTSAEAASRQFAQDTAATRQQLYHDNQVRAVGDEASVEGSLFVGGNTGETTAMLDKDEDEESRLEEEDDINQAIALSLRSQQDLDEEQSRGDAPDDGPSKKPKWTQRAAEASRPIHGASGSMIAHVVNNRSNAAVRRQDVEEESSDSEDDMQTVLAKARNAKPPPAERSVAAMSNAFGGPLPFPKLDWKASVFARKDARQDQVPKKDGAAREEAGVVEEEEGDEVEGGGFEVSPHKQDDAPKELPPWLADDTDIRESLKKQHDVEREINAEDKEEAEEEERLQRREMERRLIEIESSSDDDGDVEIIDVSSSAKRPTGDLNRGERSAEDGFSTGTIPETEPTKPLEPEMNDARHTSVASAQVDRMVDETPSLAEGNPLPADEAEPAGEKPSSAEEDLLSASASPEPEFEDVPAAATATVAREEPLVREEDVSDDDLFGDAESEDFSEPEDQELMMQMAEEAEEHARFASQLNQKSAAQNKEDYEKELRALRNQQKKDRRDADEVTQVMVGECQALLRLFGIPYVTAPMEAEAQCAELVRLGIVDGIVTDDSDTFLFGGTRVYKNMFNSNKFVECYLGVDVEKELSLSREQLISLAQLLGSDYTEGLPGVGPVTAVEILSEFPGKDGLEQFREWWTTVQSLSRPKEADASSPFRVKFRKSQATKLFLPPGFPSQAVYDAYQHPEVDDSAEPFQWGVPDLQGLRRFLMSTIGWSQERTDEVLVPVIRDMNRREAEGTQSNITQFFGGGVGAGAREAFAPRQRARGSKRMAAAVDRLRANVAGEDSKGEEQERPRKRRKRAGTRRGGRGEEDIEEEEDGEEEEEVEEVEAE